MRQWAVGRNSMRPHKRNYVTIVTAIVQQVAQTLTNTLTSVIICILLAVCNGAWPGLPRPWWRGHLRLKCAEYFWHTFPSLENKIMFEQRINQLQRQSTPFMCSWISTICGHTFRKWLENKMAYSTGFQRRWHWFSCTQSCANMIRTCVSTCWR